MINASVKGASKVRARRGLGRRGHVALEFAAAAIPLMVLLLGTMEVGYDLYVQEALDNAVETAARSVQVGSDTGTNNENSGTFAKAAVCPALRALLNCSQIVVAVEPLPSSNNLQYDYYTAPAQGSNTGHYVLSLGSQGGSSGAAGSSGCINTGTAGQMMLITAWYIGPTFVGGLIPAFATNAFNNHLQHITSASAGFVNEQFSGGQSQGAGC
jgi:Flp pilus assembly protein TadG